MTYHLLEAAAAMVVVVVCLEVLGKVLDAAGKERDLYLGRTCVALVCSISFNNCLLFCLKHDVFTFLKIIIYRKHSNRWVKCR